VVSVADRGYLGIFQYTDLLFAGAQSVSYCPVESELHSFTVDRSNSTTATDSNTLSTWTTTSNYAPILSYSISPKALSEKLSAQRSVMLVSTPQGSLPIDEKQYLSSDMSGAQEVWIYLRQSEKPGVYDVLAITQAKSAVAVIMQQMRMSLILAIPVTLLLVGGLGFFLVRKMLRPVETITLTAKEIKDKYLNRRIPVETNDELGQLSQTLNDMFGRLQSTFERERQFTSDASHELRTPLAIIQGEASLALNKQRSADDYRKSLEAISVKVSDMSLMVEKLLNLSQADNAKEALSSATWI